MSEDMDGLRNAVARLRRLRSGKGIACSDLVASISAAEGAIIAEAMAAFPPPVDCSVEADARRFRWLLDGNGYFMEHESLCGSLSNSDEEAQMNARRAIDRQMEGN